jgi:hypothetical protein
MIAPSSWALLLSAVLVYTLHHGLAKSALFLTLGVSARDGAARAWRRAGVATVSLLGLSLGGMALTSGAVAKSALKAGMGASGLSSAAGIVSVLSLAAVGTTLLMARVAWLVAVSGAERPDARPGDWPPSGANGRAPVVAWAGAVALSLAAPWTLMRGLADPSAAWSPAGLPYILAGAALAGVVIWLSMRGWWRWKPQVPAGDILVPLERAASRFWHVTTREPASPGHAHPEEKPAPSRVPAAVQGPPIVEQALLHWPVYGLVVLGLLVTAAAVLVLGAG